MIMALSACGGSGNNPPPGPSVTVSPSTANVQEGGTLQFSATTANTSSSAVNWQVNGVSGGNATVGTVSSTGLYTAPNVIPSPASVTVSAVLQADSSVSGNGIVTVTSVTFSDASLKGNYVFSLSGIDSIGAAFYAVGTVVADGNGNITSGEEDLNDASSGYATTSSVTGTYSVDSDGRGLLTLNSSLGGFQYAIAIRALNNAGLNEIDNQVTNATGNLEFQSASVSQPSGNYAFGFAGLSTGCGTPGGALNSDGVFGLSTSGSSIGGVQDVNCGGTITQSAALSGSYSNIDGLGRGRGSFSSSAGSSDYIYYAVSANRFRFICTDSGTVFQGTADLQTQSSFAGTDFSGSYVISTSANTPAGVSYTLIQINASGGSVSSGYYDVNDTGTVGQASLSGAYSVGSNGRVGGSWSVNGVGLPYAMYMVSPSAAYYLDERTAVIGGGNVYAQSANVTSNSAWAGSYATKQFGYFIASSAPLIRYGNSTSISGQISADGNGNLAGTLDFNDPTSVYPDLTLQGTYSVGNVAPGRMTLSITTAEPIMPTRNYVGYIVSPTQVLLMENDTNLTAGGDAIRQF
jgi:hypothetical protein